MNRVRRVVNYGEMEQLTYTGKDVYVAVLDSGIANHPDFENRILAFRDFTRVRGRNNISRYYDNNGHGTHV